MKLYLSYQIKRIWENKKKLSLPPFSMKFYLSYQIKRIWENKKNEIMKKWKTSIKVILIHLIVSQTQQCILHV